MLSRPQSPPTRKCCAMSSRRTVTLYRGCIDVTSASHLPQIAPGAHQLPQRAPADDLDTSLVHVLGKPTVVEDVVVGDPMAPVGSNGPQFGCVPGGMGDQV